MSILKVPIIAAIASAALGVGLAHMRPEMLKASFGAVQQTLPLDAGSLASSDTSGPASPTRALGAAADPWRVEIAPDAMGQYVVDMTINGRDLGAMVDTGATYVALSYEAAASLGIHPAPADFKYLVQTANGSARAAEVVIPRIQVGRIEARDVEAIVAQPGALTSRSLLGMSFLRKLTGFQVESGRLVLKQ